MTSVFSSKVVAICNSSIISVISQSLLTPLNRILLVNLIVNLQVNKSAICMTPEAHYHIQNSIISRAFDPSLYTVALQSTVILCYNLS